MTTYWDRMIEEGRYFSTRYVMGERMLMAMLDAGPPVDPDDVDAVDALIRKAGKVARGDCSSPL